MGEREERPYGRKATKRGSPSLTKIRSSSSPQGGMPTATKTALALPKLEESYEKDGVKLWVECFGPGRLVPWTTFVKNIDVSVVSGLHQGPPYTFYITTCIWSTSLMQCELISRPSVFPCLLCFYLSLAQEYLRKNHPLQLSGPVPLDQVT